MSDVMTIPSLSEVQQRNLDAALALANAGISIFPAQQDKTPLYGLKWRAESTTDLDKITGWWRLHPDSIPAIDVAKSRLLVIDLDKHAGQPDGEQSFKELAAKYQGEAVGMPVVKTSGGGLHLYFQQPENELFGNTEGEFKGKGINVRGSGGYGVMHSFKPPYLNMVYPRYEVILNAIPEIESITHRFPLDSMVRDGGLRTEYVKLVDNTLIRYEGVLEDRIKTLSRQRWNPLSCCGMVSKHCCCQSFICSYGSD